MPTILKNGQLIEVTEAELNRPTVVELQAEITRNNIKSAPAKGFGGPALKELANGNK